jgi:SAM-dependent methyltransferase
MKCSLCQTDADFFYRGRIGEYSRCPVCRGIFLSPEYFLDASEEKSRYETHNNDVTDLRYQKFVTPMVDEIVNSFSTNHKGLDFGCGTGPVIEHLLRQKGFSVDLYDPFFRNNQSVLTKKYDFIACCEIIEHFQKPDREFQLLFSLLNPGGKLFCMTDFYRDNTDFKNWNYKEDATHVFFYHKDTLKFILENFGFVSHQVKNRLVIFEKNHNDAHQNK